MNDPTLAIFFQRAVVWVRTDRAEFPYIAEVNGQNWRIRINNFPEE